MKLYQRPEFEAATESIWSRIHLNPRIGIVLGSGLSDFAASIEDADIIPYEEIPHWPLSTVEGHSGKLYVGTLESQPVMVMSGRAHSYEGYPMSQVTLPIRVMQLLGVEIAILTNAAGGINRSFSPGDLMLINDHINLIGMTGGNPLRGPNDSTLGVRFPDMGEVYDRTLRQVALEVAGEEGIPLQQGIYICLAGPSFETPADIRFLRMIGADAVGMSTVPEATVARHGSMRVLGLSGISNTAIDTLDSTTQTTHDEVLDSGKIIVPRLKTILRGVLKRL